tara:strand:+ start:128 stop:424 length:297 start_codon:yes stop_codon:yes gene_type:complete
MVSFSKQVEYYKTQIAKSYFKSKGMLVIIKNEGRDGSWSTNNEYIANYYELYSDLDDKEKQELDKLLRKKEIEDYSLFYIWLIIIIVMSILGFIGMLS